MCQLTFINTHNSKLNALALQFSLLINSREKHKDGFGFYNSGTGLVKFVERPSLVSLKDFTGKINNTPVIAHVRWASLTNNIRAIDVTNCHPFEKGDLILAHNGTLKFKDDPRMKLEIYKDMIDSEIFLTEFEKNYTERKGEKVFLSEVLSKTMEDFYGKFAFLIHNKFNNI